MCGAARYINKIQIVSAYINYFLLQTAYFVAVYIPYLYNMFILNALIIMEKEFNVR